MSTVSAEHSSGYYDKTTTVAKTKVGRLLERLDGEDTVRLNRPIAVFLGLGVAALITD